MEAARYYGVDIGSSYTKAVVVDAEGRVLGEGVLKTGMDFESASLKALEGAAGAPAGGAPFVATGVGRSRCVSRPPTKTEISCIARGSFHHLPRPHVVVDIGGQDNKVVRVDGQGRQLDFKLNRKCAAGTGAFLEEIARRLDLAPEGISELARRAPRAVEIGSYCTVFTCTEIIHHIREGASPEGILRGCYESVVKRILEMDPLQGEVAVTGGVIATHPVLADLLTEKLGRAPFVPPRAQFIGALGAALLSREGHHEAAPV
ncbi:MAG: ATPase [Elusimicrobia bacterium]|nr:ATPase [Elusimicrobiota bacterium]